MDWTAMMHIGAGSVALAGFWGAALSRKGSSVHRFAGRFHLVAMLVILVTAVPLTARAFGAGHTVTGFFFLYLIILVAHSCRTAWRAIRDRRDFAAFAGPAYRIGGLAVAVAGTWVLMLGLWHGAWILVAFGALGPVIGRDVLHLVRRGPDAPNWWLRQHFGGMIGNGVATHIAFAQIGLGRVLANLDVAWIQYLAWLGPLAVGLAAGFWLERKHRPRTAG